jgi:hypothetical protein
MSDNRKNLALTVSSIDKQARQIENDTVQALP